MASDQAPAPARRLRTWSRFGSIRRVPTEYQVVTHDLNYTMRTGRAAALESNPTTPANMWFRTYRDGSPLRSLDWNGFQDPDELIYRRYVTMQDEQETVVEGILDEFGRVDHDAGLPARWVQVLAAVFTTTRYPMHALQMAEAYLGAVAPASTITNCAAFAAGDLLRRVSLIAYRTSQLRAAHPWAGFAEGERQVWENHPDWQPARRVLELALVAYDWGECLTAVNLVLRPTLDEMLLRQLGLVAKTTGDHLTWLLVGNLALDTERSLRWSAALARYAVEERADNASILRHWVDRWAPRADEAAEGLANMLSRMPEAGCDPAAATTAAREARERLLAQAGIPGPAE
ncbi:MAG TPA: toluene hydroxylase [Candidatus Dormibacteraeota bacterium]